MAASIYVIQNRELLTGGVQLEFDGLVGAMNATIGEEHDIDTGEHTDINLDSISTRDTGSYIIPITGGFRMLRGRWLIDMEGNSSHVCGLRPTLSANTNDYSPAGLATALAIEFDLDADRNLTGINRLARQKQFRLIGNRSGHTLTLKHNSTSSSAGNRFGLPGSVDLALSQGAYVWTYYDVGGECWRVLGY